VATARAVAAGFREGEEEEEEEDDDEDEKVRRIVVLRGPVWFVRIRSGGH
jgi:hypothetical protein